MPTPDINSAIAEAITKGCLTYPSDLAFTILSTGVAIFFVCAGISCIVYFWKSEHQTIHVK